MPQLPLRTMDPHCPALGAPAMVKRKTIRKKKIKRQERRDCGFVAANNVHTQVEPSGFIAP